MQRPFIAVFLAMAVAACSSSAPIQYYPLPDSAFILPAQRTQEAAVQIILAEPLKTQSLLYQSDAHQLNFAQSHLWADSPENALAANLSTKLNRLDRNTRYQPVRRSGGRAPVLKIYIETFQGNYQGYTQINGYAQWPDGHSRSFAVQTPQQGDGYAAMVDSLNEGLDNAAIEIHGR